MRWLKFHLRGIGLLGWLGLALVGGAIAYAAILVPQRSRACDALQTQIDDWRQQRVALEQKQKTVNVPLKAAVAIPPLTTTPAVLLTIENIAHQDGLELKRNDYRYVDPVAATPVRGTDSADARGQLFEVRITAPASGSYRSIRAFIAHALEQLPTLALDDMSLKRESIANGAVQAQLRFTLFVRGES